MVTNECEFSPAEYESIELIIKNKSKFVGLPESNRFNNLVSNIEHHEIKINYLNEIKKVAPSKDIEETIYLNESLKAYYVRRAVVLYSRYFINMPKN
jgi:indole-3-glycerol phosphate synthase